MFLIAFKVRGNKEICNDVRFCHFIVNSIVTVLVLEDCLLRLDISWEDCSISEISEDQLLEFIA